MACRAMYMWNLSDLIGAFVDLAIAYFLLCASVVAYIASKFLGFFGLCLPCPCCVLGRPTFSNRNYCIQRLLIDCPTGKVSNVQLSVLNKFPFNAFGIENDPNSNFGGYMIEGKNRNTGNGYVGMIEGEGSCSSVSDARKGPDVKMLDWEPDRRIDGSIVGEGGFDVKGKGVMDERARGLLRRQRGGSHSERNSSVASCDPQLGDVCGGYSSLSDSIGEGGTEMVEDTIGHLDNGIDSHDFYYLDDNHASRVIIGQRDVIPTDEIPDENDDEDRLSSSVAANTEPPQKFAPGFGDKNAVKLLEQALRDEQAARTALYIELEKERNAAASAADEAMAMILRLQEEKATVEMEARQYQRIIEEKSAYDAEEMNILKDILLIREREKHFLEEEVEEYRQIINLANGQFQDDEVEFEKKHLNSLVYPSEDRAFVIDQLSAAIDEKTSWDVMQTSSCSSNGEQNVQEKEMILISGLLNVTPQNEQRQEATTIACETSSSQEHNLSEKRVQVVVEESIQDGQGFLQDKMDSYDSNDLHMRGRRETLKQPKIEAIDEVKGSSMAISDKEPLVHDIHVIVDEPVLPDEHETIQDNFSLANDISKTISKNYLQGSISRRQSIGVLGDSASTSNLHAEKEIQKRTSKTLSRLPPVGPQQMSNFSDQRRNSMSSMDNERFKIDHEVGWLRERLKIIQEGREKLNISSEHQERDNVQLKILEDIARQLQAIRLLTESGKAVRQESLPPPSTKDTSKKRRSRSASSGVHKS